MTRFKMPIALIALAAMCVVHAEALAQDSAEKPVRSTIRVTGEATVTSKPDQAEINIGVVTQATTGQAAATQNAQKQDAVLSELRKVLGAAAEIKTISYSLSPNYRYPKEGGQPTITGYTASNIVEVKTSDLAQVGRVIDVATQSGANTVQSLRFTLKDEQRVRAQALGEAAIRARGKADALASALGLKILRVLHIDEGGVAMPLPMNTRAFSAEAGAAVSTPVESGTIEVHATVTLTVEIAQ
ncbi:MAG: SIMPL domain-containing protein [Acidobacteriota bacterium]